MKMQMTVKKLIIFILIVKSLLFFLKLNMDAVEPTMRVFSFTKDKNNGLSNDFDDLLCFLQACEQYCADYSEYGIEELHPVLTVEANNTLVIELEFIQECECKHDLKTCIDAYNQTFSRFYKSNIYS